MSTRDTYSLAGEKYDISSKAIGCRADQDGASVFVVEGRIGKLRVLDFSEREAEMTYQQEVLDELACPGCQVIPCICAMNQEED